MLGKFDVEDNPCMTFSSLAFRLGSSGIELSLGFAKNQNTQDLIHDVAST